MSKQAVSAKTKRCMEYIERSYKLNQNRGQAPTLMAAKALAKDDGFRANTSNWITAFGKWIAE